MRPSDLNLKSLCDEYDRRFHLNEMPIGITGLDCAQKSYISALRSRFHILTDSVALPSKSLTSFLGRHCGLSWGARRPRATMTFYMNGHDRCAGLNTVLQCIGLEVVAAPVSTPGLITHAEQGSALTQSIITLQRSRQDWEEWWIFKADADKFHLLEIPRIIFEAQEKICVNARWFTEVLLLDPCADAELVKPGFCREA